MQNKLVVFFSATGTTKRVAQDLSEKLACSSYEIDPVNHYTSADLDWMDKSSRASLEIKDIACRPAIKNDSIPDSITEIHLIFPIWWGIAPNVVKTFLDNINDNIKVIVYCTSGGSSLMPAVTDLEKTYPGKEFIVGKRLS